MDLFSRNLRRFGNAIGHSTGALAPKKLASNNHANNGVRLTASVSIVRNFSLLAPKKRPKNGLKLANVLTTNYAMRRGLRTVLERFACDFY